MSVLNTYLPSSPPYDEVILSQLYNLYSKLPDSIFELILFFTDEEKF